MRQGDSDQHIPCLVAKEINCGPRRSRIPQAFREGGSKKGESVLGFKRKVDTQYEGLKTDSCWFQTVQVGSRLQSRQGHLGHLSSSSQCLFLIQILFVTSLHTIASYQTGELKVETQLPIFPVPHTHASSFQESQSWGPAMKDTVGKLEASPAGQ